jgi:nucleotide-binding universal stress UspA family protein
MAKMTAIQHILVATDFSENAALALRWAVAIVGRANGRISIAHVVDSRAIGPKTSLETVEEEVKQHLRVAGDPARSGGIKVDEHVGTGKPWSVIADLAKKLGVDLIVIGTRGHNSLGEFVLGSTADRVIRIATAPVLAIHPHDQPPQLQHTRILVAHDFSKQAEAATGVAAKLLGQLGGGEITLLNVCELVVGFPASATPTFDPAYWERCETDAKQKLEAIAAASKTEGVNLSVQTARGIAFSAIVDQAKAIGANLVAVGTHGGSAVHHLIMGSVAERVLETAPCPVLTVRTAT